MYSIFYACLVVFLCVGCEGQEDQKANLSPNSFTSLSMETVFEFTESEEVAFRTISSIKTDNHGNILVLDFWQPYLYMFDKEGNFLEKIGREGRGPGEFEQISSFLVDRENLWVIDSSSLKIEKFEYSDDTYIHIKTIPLGSDELAGKILGKIDRGFLILKSFTLTAGSKENPTVHLVTSIDENGEILRDSIVSVPIAEQMTLQAGENKLIGNKLFGNESLLAFNGINYIYTLWTNSLSIESYSIDGLHKHAFSHVIQPVYITGVEKDSISSKYGLYRSDLRRKMPNVKPVVNDLLIDDNQRIWVELFTSGLGHAWFGFTKNGEALYKIEIPKKGAELQEIVGNRVIWNYQNEEGAPTFIVSKIDMQY
ncbi:MAG: 6-bladed beta-propeller [Gracilimonas sp.]|uniref:6-bladed beta-propeller n=1 Tax=Gracilimonas sp. TaxID=1974203 RepID=UPI0019A18D85|nr:6-bladed beta-propeller [Gracilimonas sp.]MBD3616999.1 6-bladed beta-propeller [Gracilimonas sp.]